MNMPDRNVYLDFQLDTNRINAKSNLVYMNILEHWHENDVIYLDIAEAAQIEASQGNSSLRSEKAFSYIASETLATTTSEQKLLRQIQGILFPNGFLSESERYDVEIVFNAYKYYRILITNDGGSKRQPGGILGNRDRLKQLGIQVTRDHESVELVKNKILKRDKIAKLVSSKTGERLPAWVDNDLEILKSITNKQ